MAKIDFLQAKMSQNTTLPENFFDYMVGPPVRAFFTPEDHEYIRKLVTRNLRNDIKLKHINAFMKSKGFGRLDGGTNRVVYRYFDDTSFVLKLAFDRVAMQDNLLEFKNQQFLKPYVCKIFDVTPDGLMATVERVMPISSKEEFKAMEEEIFHLITTKIIGKYVAEDIGKSYFKNYGTRVSFGPVLVDYPYIYPLAEEKLFCTYVDPRTNMRCTGMIDYDDGFNHLYCRKCGKRYLAHDLEDKNPVNDIIINRGGRIPMKVRVIKNDGSIVEPVMSSSIMERRMGNYEPRHELKVKVVTVDSDNNVHEISCSKEEEKNVIKEPNVESIDLDATVNSDDNVTEKENNEVETFTETITSNSEKEKEVENTNVSSMSMKASEAINSEYKKSNNEEHHDDETIKLEVEAPKTQARDANGRFTKKEEKNADLISKIEDSGVSKYPVSKKSKKAGEAKKAGSAKVNSKFIPSPGIKEG